MIKIHRFPIVSVKKIPSAKDTGQVFVLPGILVGRGYFSLFWIRWMMTINFNTIIEIND